MSTSIKPANRPVSAHELDIVAQAFGFRSANHLQSVIDGNSPSALAEGNPKWRQGLRAAVAVEDAYQFERTAIDREEARAKQERRRQNSRDARYRVLARKAAEREAKS